MFRILIFSVSNMEVITCGIPSCKAHEKENIYKIAVISLVLFLIGADQSFYDEES